MDDSMSLVLDFLRQHNFVNAEEALRLELQARHSFARPTSSHDKVEVACHGGGFTARKDCQGNAVPSVDKAASKVLQQKLESDSLKRSGIVDNQVDAYAEWEFRSSSNNDCVLEFKKQHTGLRRTLEFSSSNHHEVRTNGVKLMNCVHEEMGLGRRTGHAYKNVDNFRSPENGKAIELALTQKQQQESESTCDLKACRSSQLQQDLGTCEPKECSCMDVPKLAVQKFAQEVKALSPQRNTQNFARSAYNSVSDTSWDFGVWDNEAIKSSKFTQPSLQHPLACSEEFDQLEEKRVVHDCIDYIKALALDNQTYLPDSFKDISLPREIGLQNHLVEQEYLNERNTQDCSSVLSPKLGSNSGSFSITYGFADSFGLDKLHTNALFEPAFNLGSFLDIPVGQGTTSPGEKDENGVCQLFYSQNAMHDTPELLSGFATLGDEPADAGMGHCKEYWGSDMYEDDEDPGYDRREVEDEVWFLAHEIIYPNEEDEGEMIKKKVVENLLSHSNEGNEMMQGKEDAIVYTKELLDTAVFDGSQAKLDTDILSISTLLEHSNAGDFSTFKQFESMSYDGHLMDAQELKFMGVEPVWQGCSSQVDKHIHYDRVDKGEAYGKPCGDYMRQIYPRSDTEVEKATEGRKFERDALHELNGQIGDSFDRVMYPDGNQRAESIRNVNGIQNSLKLEASGNSRAISIGDAFSCLIPLDVSGCEARDEETAVYTYDSAVNEPAADDGEMSTAQEEAHLLPTEEHEYEVFSLRIIHRKNRTGFEEEKHFQVVLNSVVAGRYLITEYLGSAAFSKAVQARDLQTGMDVCMKIIKNNKDFFDQSLDEIKLLKFINKNDPADKHHLLRLYDYFYHKEHLFIVCELLRANLYEFYKFNKESGGEPYFTMSRLQSITRQCLEALEFLHCLGLIHCDLKPENILIKSYSRCEVKVIDLGSSCFQTDHLCSYVQSRSYRAPEVILGLPYDQKIDIWSLGCILAELCSGHVLFQNDSLATLLARVTGIIEPIMPDMILKGKEAHKYFTKTSMLFERNQDTNKLEYLIPKRSSLRHRLPLGDLGFVDFVGYLLQVNPENRPSASEALKHPWLTHPYEPIC